MVSPAHSTEPPTRAGRDYHREDTRPHRTKELKEQVTTPPRAPSDHSPSTVDIRDCTPDLLPGAIDVLGQAFAQETFTKLTLGERVNDLGALRDLFQLQVDGHLSRGGIIDVAVMDGEVVGAAMWEHPDGDMDTTEGTLSNLRSYLRLTGPRLLRAAVGALRVVLARPKRRHWYLHMVGAHPNQQGLGIGSRLLEYGLERIGNEEPAYLESSNDGTSRLYAKYGFLPAGTIRLWPRYHITRMWRPKTR